MATRLPFRSFSVAMPESLPATMAMPLLDMVPTTVNGSCATTLRMEAAMPKVPKSTERLTTAFLPSDGLSNGTTSMRRPSGANCW